MEQVFQNAEYPITTLEDFMLGIQVLDNYGPNGSLKEFAPQAKVQLDNLTGRLKQGLKALGGRKKVDELI